MSRATPIAPAETTVWIVEAQQPSGRWEAVAAPAQRPFNEKRARKVHNELVKRFPNLRDSFRVWPYRQMRMVPALLESPPEALMSIVYRGEFPARQVFRVNPELGTEAVLEHRILHSPTGFNWGYSGSGPAELARCLLWDVLGYQPDGMLYQDFKAAMIAPLPQERSWSMPIETIVDWLARRDPPVHVMTPTIQKFRELLAEAGYELSPREILDVLSKAEMLARDGACPTCGHKTEAKTSA